MPYKRKYGDRLEKYATNSSLPPRHLCEEMSVGVNTFSASNWIETFGNCAGNCLRIGRWETLHFQQHPEESSIEKPTPQANRKEAVQTTGSQINDWEKEKNRTARRTACSPCATSRKWVREDERSIRKWHQPLPDVHAADDDDAQLTDQGLRHTSDNATPASKSRHSWPYPQNDRLSWSPDIEGIASVIPPL